MENVILFLTDQNDQTDTILSSALMPSYCLEKQCIIDNLDPELLLSTRPRRPDCILVNCSVLLTFRCSISRSLSVINRSVPVITLLPFEDPEVLRTLLDNRLFNYIIFPLSIKNLRARIEEIIAIHSEEVSLRDSFFLHPFFSEFRHELLNPLTIAAGYVDMLSSSISDENASIYWEKIYESIKKIQSLLSPKN